MRLDIALLAATAVVLSAGAAQAAVSVEIRDAAARVTIVPEDRSDVRVEVVTPNAKLPLTVRSTCLSAHALPSELHRIIAIAVVQRVPGAGLQLLGPGHHGVARVRTTVGQHLKRRGVHAQHGFQGSRIQLDLARAVIADGDFQLVVQDNGDGITSEPDGRLDRGHGMATMKQRAKQMQGQCLVESGPGFGTVIRLTLPLDRAMEGA